MPEVRRGVVAATGGTQRLPRLIGPTRAKQLLLVGDPIDAVAAERCGLVNWVVPDGTALAHARRIADRIVARRRPRCMRRSASSTMASTSS